MNQVARSMIYWGLGTILSHMRSWGRQNTFLTCSPVAGGKFSVGLARLWHAGFSNLEKKLKKGELPQAHRCVT